MRFTFVANKEMKWKLRNCLFVYLIAVVNVCPGKAVKPGVSNSRPVGCMQPRMWHAKALFAARDTMSEIQKIWDNNKSF